MVWFRVGGITNTSGTVVVVDGGRLVVVELVDVEDDVLEEEVLGVVVVVVGRHAGSSSPNTSCSRLQMRWWLASTDMCSLPTATAATANTAIREAVTAGSHLGVRLMFYSSSK
jgi:hypothetical protein